MPAGRPTKYKPSMCQIVESCMAEGMSKTELCRELDICWETLCNWQREHNEFLEAIKRGELLSQAWWEEKGRTNLSSRDFNPTLWFMNMKNRFSKTQQRWADKHEQEQYGKDGGPIQTQDVNRPKLSKEEWLKAHGIK